MNLIQIAKEYAIRCHYETNHLYDGKPYSVHLSMVYDFGLKFAYLLDPDDVETTLASCWTHDTIEDTRQTYNDVKQVCGVVVAEITYALRNEKGKTRKERANNNYYNGINAIKNAPFVKICDRLANAKYSKDIGSSQFEMYKKEHKDFVNRFGWLKNQLKPMFEEMDAIFM